MHIHIYIYIYTYTHIYIHIASPFSGDRHLELARLLGLPRLVAVRHRIVMREIHILY